MENPKYVPIEDVAKYFSVSISTKDTYIKVGNTYRFCVDDVADALTKTKDTDEEAREEFQAEAKEDFDNLDNDV